MLFNLAVGNWPLQKSPSSDFSSWGRLVASLRNWVLFASNKTRKNNFSVRFPNLYKKKNLLKESESCSQMGQAANGLLSGNKDLAAQWTNQMSGWNNCGREKVQENSRLNVTANRAERVSGTQGVRPITKILTRKSENVYPVLQVFLRRSRAVWNRILSTRIGFSSTRNQWIRSPIAHRFETVPQSSLRPHPHEPGKKNMRFQECSN